MTTKTKLTTKEMRTRLKAEVKAMMAKGIALRIKRKACGKAGDQYGANSARLEQVDYHRPRARALYLAYAFIKGRTYHQVEAKYGEDNEPYGYLGPLQDWKEDADLACDWIDEGDVTLFDLLDRETDEKAEERPRVEPVPKPAPTGLLGRLRAAVGM